MGARHRSEKQSTGCSAGVPPAVSRASCPRRPSRHVRLASTFSLKPLDLPSRGSGTLPPQRARRPRYKLLLALLVETGYHFDPVNQHEVVEGQGVSNDNHQDWASASLSSIRRRLVSISCSSSSRSYSRYAPWSPEEAVHLQAGFVPQDALHLPLRERARAITLRRNGFQNMTRHVLPLGP